MENDTELSPQYIMNALTQNPKLNINDKSLHIPVPASASNIDSLTRSDISHVQQQKEKRFTLLAQDFQLDELLSISKDAVPVPILPAQFRGEPVESKNQSSIHKVASA